MSFINMTHSCTGDINALYSNGITTTIYSFNDSPEYNRWDEEVQSIKDEIAAINDKRISGSLSQTEQDKKFMVWLDHVKRFTNTFGDARVPDDIKFAVNSVEEGCHVAVTKWVHNYNKYKNLVENTK